HRARAAAVLGERRGGRALPEHRAGARVERLRLGRRHRGRHARRARLRAHRERPRGGGHVALKHQAPRGTRDLLPGELERWQWVEARAREVLARYGYGEIRTPMFEDYELFARTSGEASEMVQKEMYRSKYGEALRQWLAPARAQLSADSQRRLDENPLRVLDSKDPQDLAVLTERSSTMPRLLDALDEEARAHWTAVLARLDAAGVKHE